MAKNRSKKKSTAVSMDITVADSPQAMDTSETAPPKSSNNDPSRRPKKGRPMKRSKNVRNMKAIEKAISQSEKIAERVMKTEGKTVRTQSAKVLYD